MSRMSESEQPTEAEAFKDYPLLPENTQAAPAGDLGEFVDTPSGGGSWSKTPEQMAASQPDPLEALNAKLASGQTAAGVQEPSGFGPVTSGEEYAAGHPMTKEMNVGGGVGTVLRSAAETAMPYTNELTAKWYASKYPQLSEDQWFKVLTERENKYHQESPVMSRVSDIAGAGIGLAGGGGVVSSLFEMPAAIGAGLASAYGVATSPGVPQMRMDEPGYMPEALTASAVGALAPVAGPAIVTAITAPVKAGVKYLGRGSARIMALLAKDTETADVYRNWAKNETRYLDIKDPKLERTKVYNEFADALAQIKEAAANNKLTEKEAADAYKQLSRDYSMALSDIKKSAAGLTEPPAGTAAQVAKHIDNFKQANYDMYDRAFELAPSTEEWIANPKKFGIPYSTFRDSAEEAIVAITGGMKGPEKVRIAEEARALLNYHTGEMVDDARRVIGGSPSAGSVLKDILATNGSILRDKKAFTDRLRNSGVSLDEVVSLSGFFDNMNPQSIRPYMTSLFKRGQGFSTLQDQAATNSNMLQSEIGKKVATKWRGIWLDKVSNKPEMAAFKKANKEASDININFLKPLEDRFTVRGANEQGIATTFKAIANDTEEQMMNSLRAASRYGNQNDQTLIDLATKLKAADDSTKSLASLPIDKAIQNIADRETLADEALSLLSKMDPKFRIQFSDLEQLAARAMNSKDLYRSMAKQAEEHAKKYSKALGYKYKSIEDAVNMMGTGRVRHIDPNGVRTDAEEGLRNIAQWNQFGDESAANKALDQLSRLREIGLMDRRTVQGSRQTGQAAGAAMLAGKGVGAVTGLSIDPATSAALGIVGNAFADRFTAGKWSNLTPWIIEKMMNAQVGKYKTQLGRGLMSGIVGREIQDAAFNMNVSPGSPEALEAISIIRSDNKLNPQEKIEAIKKINEDGINF